MKIINLITNIVFSLPKIDAEKLLRDFPDDFAKYGKSKKLIKESSSKKNNSSVLNQILDE